MTERYDSFEGRGGTDDDCPYQWISEWLCEYVDGTMDPSMQAVFEEYLAANPELADHVEQLGHTRALLGKCGCHGEMAERAKARLRRARGASETAAPAPRPSGAAPADSPQEVDHDPLPTPLTRGTVVAVASAMTLMLGVGMFAGASLLALPSEKAAVTQAVTAPERAPDRAAVPPQSPSSAAAPGARLVSGFEAPPFPMKKMPITGDSAVAGGARPLVQQTGLNP